MSSETPARDEGPTATDRPGRPTSLSIEHPDLGPATAILDDRQRTRRDLWLALACVAAGLLGVYFGVTDAQAGDGTAIFWTFCGLILVAYGVALLRSVVLRFMKPVRLVLAESGFDYAGRPGNDPVRWDEVAAVELEIPAKQTRPVGVCYQVRAPEEFAERHGLSARAERRLVAADGWINVRGETAMPLDDVVGMMRERIAEAEASSTDEPLGPRPKRRPRRTSRH